MTESTKAKIQAVRADLIAKRDAGQWENQGLEEVLDQLIASLDQQIEEAK